jgi:hypothetical protein
MCRSRSRWLSLYARVSHCHSARLCFDVEGELDPFFFTSSRVSIVNYRGQTLLDWIVAPTEPVVSYRTNTTGLEAAHFGKPSLVTS